MNPADDQNLNDVNKQYQDILNKYASDIKNVTPEAETPPIEPAATMVEAPSEPVEAPPIVPEPSVLDEVPPTPVITPPPLPLSPPSFVVDGPLTPPETQPKKSGNIFKYLFYISFLVFLGVCGAIAYTLFFNPPTPPSSNQTATPTPTPSSPATCQLNDKTYQVGESVPSADGCNSCSCSSDGTIACTAMACDTTPSASPASSSSSLKKYSNDSYGVSFDYPNDWSFLEIPNDKYVGVEKAIMLSKDGTFPPPATGAAPFLSVAVTTQDPALNWNNKVLSIDFQKSTMKIGSISGSLVSGESPEFTGTKQYVIFGKIAANKYVIVHPIDESAVGEFKKMSPTFKFL